MTRYEVSGLPPEAADGITAFTPGLTPYAGSGRQSYKYGLTGGPALGHQISTVSTAPGNGEILRLAYAGTSTSAMSPDSFWPDHYQVTGNRAELPGAGMPIQRYNPVRPQDTTMIPVPATSLRTLLLRYSAALAQGVSPGGQRDISAWARGLKQWRGRNSATKGGQ